MSITRKQGIARRIGRNYLKIRQNIIGKEIFLWSGFTTFILQEYLIQISKILGIFIKYYLAYISDSKITFKSVKNDSKKYK